ncbi:hypothetical protein KSF_084200 [Reticulibacter mediterranei]|uniref:Uncharacterized protein n=1 Tax=Reticulibacter mediterranei TaxID=2778369 RepID=A0A8J3N8L3_9CHLR|nr:hypothetical protein [Reticulibacter mediterranei]GHO98372.1 hypothetical protein KSF_084200 [Reticulibacter mediterranei]
MNIATIKVKREEWDEKYEKAKQFMASRKDEKSILIEVAAQHPLVEGLYPNEEFAERLLFGKKLYEERKKEGYKVALYIPGSRHMHEGAADKVALCEAGKTFLLQHDVPESVIHGDDLNRKYKGEKGVYNSADECFVAASYFKDGGFGQLYSILSPLQIYRKALHYIWFGVLPLFYTAPTAQTYHNYIKEVYELIPYVRDIDPDMQGEDSYYGNLWRRERKPV